jgi:hypothetical protein
VLCCAGQGVPIPLKFKRKARSPPIGGGDWSNPNQAFVADDDYDVGLDEPPGVPFLQTVGTGTQQPADVASPPKVARHKGKRHKERHKHKSKGKHKRKSPRPEEQEPGKPEEQGRGVHARSEGEGTPGTLDERLEDAVKVLLAQGLRPSDILDRAKRRRRDR